MISIPVDQHITLRTFHTEDAQELFDVIAANRAHLTPWLNWVHTNIRVEHSLKFIQDSQHEANMQQSLALGIFKDGKIIGGLGMHHWDHATRKADIGYWLDARHTGSGLITRCARKLIAFLFKNTDLNKLEIRFSVKNTASARVAELLGFKVEGIIRQALLRNNLIEDVVITGLLRTEYINS